jgi:hypothetical protein
MPAARCGGSIGGPLLLRRRWLHGGGDGGKVLEGIGGWDWPTSSLPLAGGPRVDAGGRVRCPGRCNIGPNLGQGWVKPDGSVRMRRTAGEGVGDALVRSDQIGRPWADANGPSWTICVRARTENVSLSGPTGQRVQRADTSCPTVFKFGHRVPTACLSVFPPRRWLYPTTPPQFPKVMFPPPHRYIKAMPLAEASPIRTTSIMPGHPLPSSGAGRRDGGEAGEQPASKGWRESG